MPAGFDFARWHFPRALVVRQNCWSASPHIRASAAESLLCHAEGIRELFCNPERSQRILEVHRNCWRHWPIGSGERDVLAASELAGSFRWTQGEESAPASPIIAHYDQ